VNFSVVWRCQRKVFFCYLKINFSNFLFLLTRSTPTQKLSTLSLWTEHGYPWSSTRDLQKNITSNESHLIILRLVAANMLSSIISKSHVCHTILLRYWEGKWGDSDGDGHLCGSYSYRSPPWLTLDAYSCSQALAFTSVCLNIFSAPPRLLSQLFGSFFIFSLFCCRCLVIKAPLFTNRKWHLCFL